MTVIIGLIDRNCEKEDTSTYFDSISEFRNQCDKKKSEFECQEKKEIVIEFAKTKYELNPVVINNENVETDQEYKYLGFIVDDKLNGNAHVNRIY